MNIRFTQLAFLAVLSTSACEKDKKEAEPVAAVHVETPSTEADTGSTEADTGSTEADTGSTEADKQDRAPTPTTDVGAARPTEIAAGVQLPVADIPLIKTVGLGTTLDVDALKTAFPGARIREEPQMAEGDVVGTEYHVANEFIVFTDSEGTIRAVELTKKTAGVAVEPGVSTYNDVKETLGLGACENGNEDTAHMLVCETNQAGLHLYFDDKENVLFTEKGKLSAKKAAKVLGTATVKYVRIQSGR